MMAPVLMFIYFSVLRVLEGSWTETVGIATPTSDVYFGAIGRFEHAPRW